MSSLPGALATVCLLTLALSIVCYAIDAGSGGRARRRRERCTNKTTLMPSNGTSSN